MLNKTVVAMTVVFILLFIGYNEIRPATSNLNKPTITPTPTPYIFSEKKLWTLINEWQTSQGFKPYKEDSRLCKLAETRLSETQTNWSHNGFWKHTKDFAHNGLSENLAKDYKTEQETLESWLGSPTHRANLEKYYEYSCVKCDTLIGNRCVQLFANFGNVKGVSNIQPTSAPVVATQTPVNQETTTNNAYSEEWYRQWKANNPLYVTAYPTYTPYPTMRVNPSPTAIMWTPIPTLAPYKPLNVNDVIQFHDNPPEPTAPYGYGYSP